ncbi:MAG: hypothetical protein IJ568_06900 [Bacilli bacterium]|nr:hypothetical protein [Bacilli bacterium]
MKKIVILLLVPLLFVGCGTKEEKEEKKTINTQIYETIENMIEVNSRYYIMEKGITDGRIEFDTLIEEGHITKDMLRDTADGSMCDGYVEVVGGKSKVYLNCNNYKTK